MEKILQEQVIRARDQNKVFVERANRPPRSSVDVIRIWKVRYGKGAAYVEFDAEDAEVLQQYNAGIKRHELYMTGDVTLAGRNLLRRRNR